MLIYRSRMFDLYTGSVNSRQFPVEYIAHKGSCGALIVNERDKVGLLTHYHHTIGRSVFEMVNGTLDHQRTIEEIMSDEIKIHTGITVSASQFERLTSLYSAPEYNTEVFTVFLVRVQSNDQNGHNALHWLSMKELERLISKGEFADMRTVAAIMAYRSHSNFGHYDKIL